MSTIKDNTLPKIKTISNRSLLHAKKNRPKTPIGQYIQESFKKVESGCYQNNKLDIDGGIGDYKMSIFRLKDRKRRIRQIPTMFTQTFVSRVKKMVPEAQEQLNNILKIPNDQYLAQIRQKQRKSQPKPSTLITKPIYQPADGEHLYYNYLSNYQREKWFTKTIDNSEQAPKEKIVRIEKNEKKVAKKNRRKSDRTHFFRFMDKSLLLSTNLSNNFSSR